MGSDGLPEIYLNVPPILAMDRLLGCPLEVALMFRHYDKTTSRIIWGGGIHELTEYRRRVVELGLCFPSNFVLLGRQ